MFVACSLMEYLHIRLINIFGDLYMNSKKIIAFMHKQKKITDIKRKMTPLIEKATNPIMKQQMQQMMDMRIEAVNSMPILTPADEVEEFLEEHNRDLSGMDLDGYNFHGVDLSGVKFDGANLMKCNFSGCKNINFKSLNKAENMIGANLHGLDLKGMSFAVKLRYGLNLTNCTNIDWESMNRSESIESIEGMNFRGLDLSELDFLDKKIEGIGLSGCTNINWESLNKVKNVGRINFSGIDLSEMNFTDKYCHSINLSGCKNINWGSLNKAAQLANINFSGLDLAEMDFTDKFCPGINLSGCTNINWESLSNADGVKGLEDFNVVQEIGGFSSNKIERLSGRYQTILKRGRTSFSKPFDDLYKAALDFYKLYNSRNLTSKDFADSYPAKELREISLLLTEKNDHLDSYILPENNRYKLEFLPKGKTVLKNSNQKLEKEKTDGYFKWVEEIYIDYQQQESFEKRKESFEDRVNEMLGMYDIELPQQSSIGYKIISLLLTANRHAGRKLIFPEDIRKVMLQYHFLYETDIANYVGNSREIGEQKIDNESAVEKEWRQYDSQLSELQILFEETIKNDDTSNIMKGLSDKERSLIEKEFAELQGNTDELLKLRITKEVSGKVKASLKKIKKQLAITDERITVENKIRKINAFLRQAGFNAELSELKELDEYEAMLEKSKTEQIAIAFNESRRENLNFSELYGLIMLKDMDFIRGERNKFTIEKPQRGKARKELYQYLESKTDFPLANLFIVNKEGHIHYQESIKKSKNPMKAIEAKLKEKQIELSDVFKNLIYKSTSRHIKEEKVSIVCEFSKKLEDFDAREVADVCVKSDKSMWKRPTYFELVIRDKEGGEILGTTMLEYVKNEQGTTLVFCPNPSDGLLKQANNRQVYNGLFNVVIKFAEANGVDRIVRSVDNGAYTNRINFPEFVRAGEQKHQGKFTFENKVPFSSEAYVYDFKEMIVLWEKGQ